MLKIQLVTYLWYDSFLISPFICINLYTFEVYVLKISALKLQKIIKLLIPKHATLISKHPVLYTKIYCWHLISVSHAYSRYNPWIHPANDFSLQYIKCKQYNIKRRVFHGIIQKKKFDYTIHSSAKSIFWTKQKLVSCEFFFIFLWHPLRAEDSNSDFLGCNNITFMVRNHFHKQTRKYCKSTASQNIWITDHYLRAIK